MRRLHRATLIGGVAAILAACASGSQASADPDVSVRRSDRNVITAEEIAQSGATTAQQAIERLRPNMLSGRTSPTIHRGGNQDQLQVYIDNQRFGGVDQLGSIQALDIQEIRYLSAVDATNRFGTGHSHGAILITRKRR